VHKGIHGLPVTILFGAMKRRLLLGCLAMLALIALGIFAVRFASQGPELAVGSTVKEPWKYFTAKAEARPDGRFRQTLCGSPAIDKSQGTIVNYVTQFSILLATQLHCAHSLISSTPMGHLC